MKDDPLNEDWKAAWSAVMQAIGTDIGLGEVQEPADAIEAGTLRRYLEPLEFDCPLHHDKAVAQEHGYADVIAPYTSAISFTMPAMWQAGDPPLFDSSDRDAQPERSAVKPCYPDFFPSFIGYFATDMDIEYLRPLHIGERVSRRGAKLVACDPRETRVGRGAFLKTEAEIVTDNGEVVARVLTGLFLYNPHQAAV